MKFKNLLGLSLALLSLAACKKDNPKVESPIEKPPGRELIRDSASYTLDGKLYTVAKYWSGSNVSNRQSNAKVDSIVNHAYYISGDKDSLMYSKTYTLYDDVQTFAFTFIQKYNKNVMTKGFLYEPADIRSFYAVGTRNYAVDYGRKNSQNGVGIAVRNEQGYFKTYGSEDFHLPPTLSDDVHKDSKFEIISIKKSKTGLYILEAKFNAALFDSENRSIKLNNGYLRINLGLLDEYYPIQ